MLRINLLQMKSKWIASGVLAEVLGPLGLTEVSTEELAKLRVILLKTICIVVGIYLGAAIPAHFLQKEIDEVNVEIAKMNTQLEKLRLELKAKQSIREEMKAMAEKEEEIKRKIKIISKLKQERYSAFRVMDTVSLLIPKEVWIKNADFSGAKLKLQGESWEFIPINEFVSGLKQSQVFTDVKLVAVNSKLASNQIEGIPKSLQKIKSFEVQITINQDFGKEKEKEKGKEKEKKKPEGKA